MAVSADGARTDLYICDEIAAHQSWFGDEVTPKAFRRQLDDASGEVYVWIDSPGGDAFAGAAIYDALRDHSIRRGRVVAMVSLAASAASLIAMAADEIRISAVGTMMIHEPWSRSTGNASNHRAVADVLETIRDGQIDCYARRTGLSRARVAELMRGSDGNGTYMNAEGAVALGFADRVDADIDSGADAREQDARGRIASCIERGEAQARRAVVMAAARDDAPMSEAARDVEALGEALRDFCALLRGEIASDSAVVAAAAHGVRAGMARYNALKHGAAANTAANRARDEPEADADGGALKLLIQAIEDTRDQGGAENYGDDDD